MNKPIDLLENVTLENIIGLLQTDVETCNYNAHSYEQMRKGQLTDLKQMLFQQLPEEDAAHMLENIIDLQDIVAEEHLQIGFKAGIKLMNQLEKI